MNANEVIVKTLEIVTPHQVNIFDIKIPRQAQYIIGIELSYIWKYGNLPTEPPSDQPYELMTFFPSIQLGELKVQSYDQARVFYAEELKACQNFKQTDFTEKGFKPRPFTHQSQRLEEPIKLDGISTLIQAIYKNTLELPPPYRYQVNLYVWLQNT
jgi:hypothetical protein